MELYGDAARCRPCPPRIPFQERKEGRSRSEDTNRGEARLSAAIASSMLS